MEELDNVSKKILDDAVKGREKELNETRAKASMIIEEAKNKAIEIHRDGKLEAWQRYKEFLNIELSKIKSELDQKVLVYKISLIDDVIENVKRRLSNINKKDYEKFLKKNLEILNIKSGYYQIGSEEAGIDDKMIESITDLKKADGKPDFKKGIKITKGKAEYNIAPDILVDSNIDDVRMEAALYLFGKEK
ncbi:MAG: hypothetical protein A2163_01885 [Actinobacteria bacterium RBG_13_35_12]|nr:MAG: hypothetical protein A2163_01885 [Actinobacteria bacterium RBG_13_35_12]